MTDGHLMEFTLTRRIHPQTGTGSIGGVNAYLDDDELPTVILSLGLKDGTSWRVYLHEGDTFEIGPELWQVTEIKRPNSPRWAAVLTQLR